VADERMSIQRLGDDNCNSELSNFPNNGVLSCPKGDGIRVEINDPDQAADDT
jgi:hypothetical protein